MNYILLITLIYVLIIIIQCIYLKKFVSIENKELEKKIDWNIKHIDILKFEMGKILSERVNYLKNKKMTYEEWIKYNNENVFIEIEGNKYYMFAYEMLENTNKRFINKVHANPKYINLSWEDILKDVQEKLIYLKYTTDENLISNAYELSDTYSIQSIEYYWLDAITNRPVNKITYQMRYYDPVSSRSGIIAIGADLHDIALENSYIYWQKISWGCPIFISLIIYFSSIILYKIKGDSQIQYKSLAFLLIMNLYITFYLRNTEVYGSIEVEQNKETSINSGIASVSFLFSVNIFILTTLQKTFKFSLFTETGVLFSISVLLLLFAVMKKTANKTTSDIIGNRLCTELLFNSSIMLNTLIIFNYILYVLSIKLGKKITL